MMVSPLHLLLQSIIPINLYTVALYSVSFEKVNKLASCLMDLAVMLAFLMFTRTFTSIAHGLKKIVAVKCICSMC